MDGVSKSAKIRLIVVGLLLAEALSLRRFGYRFGGNVVVRCRSGHLFTTLWVPGASFKAIRLGWFRVQRCPVGKHWSMVKPVRRDELTEDERRFADEHHDVKLP
jgi:hypothetical protein